MITPRKLNPDTAGEGQNPNSQIRKGAQIIYARIVEDQSPTLRYIVEWEDAEGFTCLQLFGSYGEAQKCAQELEAGSQVSRRNWGPMWSA